MILQPANLLIATGMFPLLGAIGVLLATSLRTDKPAPNESSIRQVTSGRSLAVTLVQLGFLGGASCGSILAILLAQDAQPESPMLRLFLWNWFSFSVPQSLSVTFGLEATWFKAGFIGLSGVIAFLSVWDGGARQKDSVWDDSLLTLSLLYAAGAIFVLAPSTAQAFLGWVGISGLIAILKLQIRQKSISSAVGVEDNSNSAVNPPVNEMSGRHSIQRLQRLGTTVAGWERFFAIHVWQAITKSGVNWIVEQAEVLQDDSIAIQRLATTLWASAILFAWMMSLSY